MIYISLINIIHMELIFARQRIHNIPKFGRTDIWQLYNKAVWPCITTDSIIIDMK